MNLQLIFRFSYVTETVPLPSRDRTVTYRFCPVTVPLQSRYHTVPSRDRYCDHDRDRGRDRGPRSRAHGSQCFYLPFL